MKIKVPNLPKEIQQLIKDIESMASLLAFLKAGDMSKNDVNGAITEKYFFMLLVSK